MNEEKKNYSNEAEVYEKVKRLNKKEKFKNRFTTILINIKKKFYMNIYF